MVRNFVRHLREGFYGVGRHAAMSLSSASAVTITLLLISIFLMLTVNLQLVSKGVEGSVSIYAKVSYEYETQESFDNIKSSIENIDGVKAVTFSNKETEFNYLLETYDDPETKAAIEMYRSNNPLHHAFLIEANSGEMIQSIAGQLKNIEGIDSDGINYGGDSAIMLVNSLQSINKGGFILVAGLSLLAIFLIANTIKLTIYARSNEISIMRNVGATNGFIRAPFVVEGLIIGALGAIIPMILSVFGYIYLYNMLGGVLFSDIFPLVAPHPFILSLSAVLLAIGMLVGLLGSFFSVTKYLRWKR